jgi:hypothetical protein
MRFGVVGRYCISSWTGWIADGSHDEGRAEVGWRDPREGKGGTIRRQALRSRAEREITPAVPGEPCQASAGRSGGSLPRAVLCRRLVQ